MRDMLKKKLIIVSASLILMHIYVYSSMVHTDENGRHSALILYILVCF